LTTSAVLLQKKPDLPSTAMEVEEVEREEWKKETSDVVLQS
jgi:hypothetical protein